MGRSKSKPPTTSRLSRALVAKHLLAALTLVPGLAAVTVLVEEDGPSPPGPGRIHAAKDPRARGKRRPPGVDPRGLDVAAATDAEDELDAGVAPLGTWAPGVVIDGRRPGRAGPGGRRGRSARAAGTGSDADEDGPLEGRRLGATAPVATGTGFAARVPSPPDAGDGPLPEGTGLTADIYDHRSGLRLVPRLSGVAPTLSRVDPVVDFPDDGSFGLPFEPDTFAIVWTGYLRCERRGIHAFRVGSDDGSRLEVDNTIVLDNDGLHGHEAVEGALELEAGLHLVRLVYFENHGVASARFEWQPPGTNGFAVVPRGQLYPVDTARLRDLPTVQRVAPASAAAGATVELLGRGFADVPTFNEVRFGDAQALVLEAGPERLLVAVPAGTEGGPLVVAVGGVQSQGVDFAVEGVFGLHGRFVDVEQGLDRLAPVAGPVAFETVSGLDVLHESGFGLPFAPDTFQAEWRGRLWIHRAGWHRFLLVCDDGGRLWLDGQVVVDHDGLHPPSGKEGEAFLTVGPHEVLVEHFENGGGAALRLEVEEAGKPRRVVPRGWLEPPDAVRRQRRPLVTAVDPKVASIGQQVVLRGEGLFDPLLTGPVVTLAGRPLPVTSPGWASVVVELPPGAEAGDLVVRVGPLASAPVRLEVAGTGWAADYFVLGAQLDAIPSTAGLTPTVTRIDARIDFADDAAFALPVEDCFVARWRGRYDGPVAGRYRFVLGSDDGARLVIGGARLLDDDGLHPYAERAVEVDLPAGPVSIEVEFFENGGDAACRLLVAPPGGDLAVVPRSAVRPDPR